MPGWLSPQLLISSATLFTTLGVLLVLKPGFITTHVYGKPRVCPRKLALWLAAVFLIIHCHEKMQYFYALLLQPICTALVKMCSSMITS